MHIHTDEPECSLAENQLLFLVQIVLARESNITFFFVFQDAAQTYTIVSKIAQINFSLPNLHLEGLLL